MPPKKGKKAKKGKKGNESKLSGAVDTSASPDITVNESKLDEEPSKKSTLGTAKKKKGQKGPSAEEIRKQKELEAMKKAMA